MAEATPLELRYDTPRLQRHKNDRDANEDVISGLPDELLCRILSFLPTKYAVGTCILAKRWRGLWTKVASLDFDDELLFDKKKFHAFLINNKPFVNFVNRVCDLHSVQNITKFSLKLTGEYESSLINAWVDAAICRNVVDLGLCRKGPPLERIELPQSVSSCEKLVVLKLCGDIDVELPEAVFLPCLKTLHLEHLPIGEASIEALISGSPVLQELVILRITTDNVQTLRIRSSSLKSLTIHFIEHEDFEEEYYEVVVDAPELEFLELEDLISDKYEMIQLSSLVHANVNVGFQYHIKQEFDEYAQKLVHLLRQISDVKVLSLFHRMFKKLLVAADDDEDNDDDDEDELPSFDNLPTFHNLIRLDLKTEGTDGNQLLILPDLLKCTPKLKVLVLYESCAEWMWCAPQSVPQCLLLCLEVIKFNVSALKLAEVEMAAYFLNNAMVLKKMTIASPHIDSKPVVLQKILKQPRGSRNCEIAFVKIQSCAPQA